ncbi:hypothetical protein QEN19_002384 [Hanseniaspora menglaensis]
MSEFVTLSQKKRKADDLNEEIEIDIDTTDDEQQERKAGEDNDDDDYEDIEDGEQDIDFHSVKSLLRQVLGNEISMKLNLSKIADLILEKALATNFIKCDGELSDPYCFLSFLPYDIINKEATDLIHLLKSYENVNLNIFLQSLQNDTKLAKKTCFVFSERFINMPHEVASPLYDITMNEMKENSEDAEEMKFYLIISRKYEINYENDDSLEDKEVNEDDNNKKVKHAVDYEYFHLEDEFFAKNAKIQFEGVPKKGLLPVYYLLSNDGLKKSLLEVQQEIASWT